MRRLPVLAERGALLFEHADPRLVFRDVNHVGLLEREDRLHARDFVGDPRDALGRDPALAQVLDQHDPRLGLLDCHVVHGGPRLVVFPIEPVGVLE